MLIQGGAGAVGVCAVQFARRAGATVIAAVRTGADDATAQDAGAHHVVHIGLDLVQQVHALAPQGVSHIVDVAFGANIAADVDMASTFVARSPPTPPT
jgi:NADPH2:quinone reductase